MSLGVGLDVRDDVGMMAASRRPFLPGQNIWCWATQERWTRNRRSSYWCDASNMESLGRWTMGELWL